MYIAINWPLSLICFGVECLLSVIWDRQKRKTFNIELNSYTAHYLTFLFVLILLMSYVIEEQPLSYWWKLHRHVNFSHELYYTVKFWKWVPENMPPLILKQKKNFLKSLVLFLNYVCCCVSKTRTTREQDFPNAK